MLGESALCLAFDELPQTAGQMTPVACMGDILLERLQKAGTTFRIVEGPRP
jgi:saccharopine dehydrogenase (NAD+, L-glutamate forming)